ncbi:MAG: selenocysteine-specific translation elongation factor [Gammaproteobacteria bacterium]|nr:selenocysteine-specific translation elongation factor [Gammaproteobacteria bacterium]
MIVTLAGHVDHGKTSLVHALTGVDTDTLAEEKRRGLTIDLGFAYANLGDAKASRVGFVDVPGHHRFVHNMVAGIASRQFAMLVIAADDGVMPQSREHLQILSLLGLSRGIVVLNKIDRVPPARVEEVRRDVGALTAGTFLHKAPTLPVSCTTGTGVEEVRRHIALAARADRAAGANEPFRLPIDRAFTVRGSGTVVTGTVLAGSARTDDRLVLADSGTAVRVRGVRVQNQDADAATPGDRAAINLAGVSAEEVTRGDWLLPAESREPVTRTCIELAVLADFPRAVKHNHPVHVYHASSHAQARILLIDEAPMPGGVAVRVDVATASPMHVKIGDRVVLRDHDLATTLGGGRVVAIGEPPGRRRAPGRLQLLASVQPDDAPASACAALEHGPLHAASFRRQWNLAPERMAALLGDAADVVEIDGHWLAKTALNAAETHLQERLTRHHQQHPESAGLTESELCSGDPDQSTTLRLALHHLTNTDAVRVEGGDYALASHQADIPSHVQRLFDQVERPLDSIQPPSLGDIAKRLKRPFPAFEREMRALPAFGLAIRVSDTRYYLPTRLLEMADQAAGLAAQGPFTVRNFRDATGVGRNVVIEVLEHFDRTGFTRRSGDTRTIVGNRNAIL